MNFCQREEILFHLETIESHRFSRSQLYLLPYFIFLLRSLSFSESSRYFRMTAWLFFVVCMRFFIYSSLSFYFHAINCKVAFSLSWLRNSSTLSFRYKWLTLSFSYRVSTYFLGSVRLVYSWIIIMSIFLNPFS